MRSIYPYLITCLLIACLAYACRSDAMLESWSVRVNRDAVQVASLYENPLTGMARLASRLDSLAYYRQVLHQMDPHGLTDSGRLRQQELISRLDEEWRQLQAYRTDPSVYNLGGIVKSQLSRTEKPLAERLDRIAELLDQAPAYYRQAYSNLSELQSDRLTLAVEKQLLGLQFLQQDLRDSLQRHSRYSDQWQAMIQEAGREIRSYLGFCRSSYLNQQDSVKYR